MRVNQVVCNDVQLALASLAGQSSEFDFKFSKMTIIITMIRNIKKLNQPCKKCVEKNANLFILRSSGKMNTFSKMTIKESREQK